jgi:hypothetical protein
MELPQSIFQMPGFCNLRAAEKLPTRLARRVSPKIPARFT